MGNINMATSVEEAFVGDGREREFARYRPHMTQRFATTATLVICCLLYDWTPASAV
jgi:hypothetical protein